ncbi:MAG: amine dehydrogenase large subunit [Halioglobus sp.]
MRFLLACALLCSHFAVADVPVEKTGQVESLPQPFSGNWFWASDPVLERAALVDFRRNRVLGSIDGGWGITAPVFPGRNTDEFYVPETHYSRGSRGDRTDLVTFYDSKTLSPTGEVIIPAKRAQNALPNANATLTDDEQFLVVFNMNPAQSVSVIDVKSRQFVDEIATPGCSLTYAAGERRFMMLCADGALLFVTLAEDGHVQEKLRTARFFDPQSDPLTEKGVRVGQTWYFVSFEGYLYGIHIDRDPNDAASLFSTPWSLLSDSERQADWRVGGRQLLAVHARSGTAYVLMHRGETDTHKSGGTHLWTFDLATHRKLGEYKLLSPGFSFSGVPTEFGTDWIWPFNQVYNILTGFSFQEPHARPDAIVVTQDEHPALLLGGQFSGMVAVYDASDMSFRYRVTTGNYSNLVLQLPGWGG